MPYPTNGMTTLSAGLAHLIPERRRREALDRLQKVFTFNKFATHEAQTLQNGLTQTFFRYVNPGSVTSSVPEYGPSAGTSLTSNLLSATLSEYAAYMELSKLLVDTAPDRIDQVASEMLGYQAGHTVDDLTKAAVDDEAASTNYVLPAGNLFTLSAVRGMSALLQSRNVPYTTPQGYGMIIHPFLAYDLRNDPSANGFADLMKYTNPNAGGLMTSEDRGKVATIADMDIHISTNIVGSGSPTTYRGYVFGKGALGTSSLTNSKPNIVTRPENNPNGFNVKLIKSEGASLFDPTGQIAAIASYYFTFVAFLMEGPAGIGGVFRNLTFNAESTLV